MRKNNAHFVLLLFLWECTSRPPRDDPRRISAATAYTCGKIDGHIKADERFPDQNPSSGFYEQRKARLVQAYAEKLQEDRKRRQSLGCKTSYLSQPLPPTPDPGAEITAYLCGGEYQDIENAAMDLAGQSQGRFGENEVEQLQREAVEQLRKNSTEGKGLGHAPV